VGAEMVVKTIDVYKIENWNWTIIRIMDNGQCL
jgi:hypothetical protein